MATFNRTGGGGGGIKSVQRGTFDLGATSPVNITINAVDVNKSIVICNSNINSTQYVDNAVVTGTLIDSTTVSFEPYQSPLSALIEWQVIEFSSAKSIQTALTTLSADSLDVTVNAVNTSKSILVYSNKVNYPDNSYSVAQVICYLTSSTNINMKRRGNYTHYVRWYLIEFD